jgi:hypothetical protein
MRAGRTVSGAGRPRRWWALAASALVAASVFAGSGALAAAGVTASPPPPGSPSSPVVAASSPLVAAAVSPASALIDPGESVALYGSAAGGTGPYVYAWYFGTYPACAGDVETGQYFGTGDEVNVSYTLPSGYYCYTVNDSEEPSVTAMPSSAALVTVEPRLVAGAPTPGPITIDAGKSVTLTANPTGGTGAYHIAWTSTTTGSTSCQILSVPSMPVAPTQSTSYCYTVTDTSVGTPAASNTSAPLTVTVDPALVAGAISPAAPTIDAGQTVELVAAPSGGTGAGTYTVQWYSGVSTSCSGGKAVGSNSTTYLTAALTSTTGFCYSVVDRSYGASPTYSAVATVTVKSGLTAPPVTPTAPGVDSGQSITLTANPQSGDAPYFLQWWDSTYPSCAGPTEIVGQTNTTYTFTPSSSLYYCYSVNDSSNSAHAVFSTGDPVAVNAPPTAGPIGPVSPTIDLHQYAELTANPVAGTPGYTYEWFTGQNASCSGDVGTRLPNATRTIGVNPSEDAFYCYEVFDSSKGTPAYSANSSTDEVTVNSALTAAAIVPASPTIDGGQSIVLTANASGGTPLYRYAWYSGTSCKTLIAGQTNATLVATPTANTSYCFSVTDGSADPPTVTSAADPVTVERALEPGSVTVVGVSHGPFVIDLGQAVTLSSDPTGGKAPYSTTWYSGSSPTCADDATVAGTTAKVTVAPGASTYFCYAVTDSLSNPGHVASAAVLLTVNSALAAGAITSTSTVVDSGQSVRLFAAPSGGTLNYTMTWYDGTSSNCSNDTTKVGSITSPANNITSTLSTVGTKEYCYVLTDQSVGTPAASARSATYAITVNAALVEGAPVPVVGTTASPGPLTVTRGQTVRLVANVTGGTGTLTFAWYESSTSKCNANSSRVTGADADTYTFTASTSTYYCVAIGDQSTGLPVGPYFSPAEQITVNPPPGPTFLGFPAVEGYTIVGVLGALVALVAVGLYLRLKHERRQRGPTSDYL